MLATSQWKPAGVGGFWSLNTSLKNLGLVESMQLISFIVCLVNDGMR